MEHGAEMKESLFLLPDVGEGLTEAEIVQWRVAAGDSITINQVIVEIETAKSLVELPSPYEGVVREILVGEGNTVEVGTPIIRVFGEDPDAPSTPESSPVLAEVARVIEDSAGTISREAEESPGAVLVGYGSKG